MYKKVDWVNFDFIFTVIAAISWSTKKSNLCCTCTMTIKSYWSSNKRHRKVELIDWLTPTSLIVKKRNTPVFTHKHTPFLTISPLSTPHMNPSLSVIHTHTHWLKIASAWWSEQGRRSVESRECEIAKRWYTGCMSGERILKCVKRITAA